MTNRNVVEKINELFAKRKPVGDDVKLLKPLFCNDGTSLSVQASRLHYCFPKNNEGPYKSVEVGFPSCPPPQDWAEFCTGNFVEKPCDTVYSQVPLDLVSQFVTLHGGLREEEVPQMILPAVKVEAKKVGVEKRRYELTLEDLGYRV